MSRDDILKAVQNAVVTVLEADASEVKEESTLMDQLGAESIDLLDIASELEKDLGKEIDFSEIPLPEGAESRKDLKVSEIVNFIQSLS